MSFVFDYDGDTMTGLSTVRVFRQSAVETITDNRTKHAADLVAARKGWREEVLKIGYELVQETEALACEQAASAEIINSIIREFEAPPRSHLDDYDRVIEMLQWSRDEYIELTQQEFDQYIRDEWHWKREFVTSNAKYGV